jgi:hypothetical protein
MLATAVLDVISFVIRLILLIECFDEEENSDCLSTGIQAILFLLFIFILLVLDALQLVFSYFLETALRQKFAILMASVPVSGNPSYAADPRPPFPSPFPVSSGARFAGPGPGGEGQFMAALKKRTGQLSSNQVPQGGGGGRTFVF